MRVITEYHFKNFGFSLPAACIEVSEVQSSVQKNFYDGQNERNTAVRLKVWADETARIEGKQPLEQSERYIDLEETLTNSIHNTALAALFPDAITNEV